MEVVRLVFRQSISMAFAENVGKVVVMLWNIRKVNLLIMLRPTSSLRTGVLG